MNITSQLQNLDQFSANEQSVARYILENKDAILHMSVHELAKVTFTSGSTVMRLCKKIGLSGFREFKINFARELSTRQESDVDPNFPFSRNDSIAEIGNRLDVLTKEAVGDAHQTLALEDAKRAVEVLTRAQRIVLFGVGDAYVSGLSFQARMIRAGVPVLTTSVYGEQRHLSQTLTENDCAIILSYSGTTEEIVKAARVVKKNHVSMIAITSDVKSPLAKLSDIALILPNREKKFHRLASFASHTSMEYYLNVLYSGYYVRNYDVLIQKSVD